MYHLAHRADVRATAGNAEFFDQYIWVARARLALAAKHARKCQVAPFVSLGIDVVFVGTAPFFDAQIHNVFNLGKQCSELRICDIAHARCRVDRCAGCRSERI